MSLNVPECWILTAIGESALNTDNQRKPISLSNRQEMQGQYPYYGATGQIDSLNGYTHEGEHILIGEDGANLLSKSKPLAFIATGKYWVNNHAHALKALADIPSAYLCQYVNSLDLTPWVTGSAQPKLTKKNLGAIPFPLAPLAEQKEIAARLDNLLAQVDSIKTRLDSIPTILKRFRQSVLAAAVSGRLTEEWRDGKEFHWERLTIGDLAEVKGGKRLPKGDELVTENTGFPYIRAGQLKLGTVINTEESRSKQLFLSPETKSKISRYTVKAGDLYITIVGASIGDSGVIPICYSGANLTENAAKITEFKKPLESKFLSYWLRSQELQNLIKLEIKSGAQGKLALKRIKELPAPYTDISEQNEIVRRVEQLFSFADQIEQRVKVAQSRINNLTQSILAKAFRGELTADWREQNPDLISGENAAEALLERIKAEREAMQPKKRARKRSA